MPFDATLFVKTEVGPPEEDLLNARFAPLRRRIQNGIDRRFFRKKYDAQQVLAQFARTARDETDMDALIVELERTIQETLQPEGVRVWLRKE